MGQMDLDSYHERGYLILEETVPPALLKPVYADVKGMLLRKYPPTLGPDLRKSYRETEADLHWKSAAVREMISDRPFFELSKALLGDEVDLRFCFTLTKTAEHGEPVDWHQDWGLDRDPEYPRISFWVAVTDVDSGNGCLQAIPGSHQGELLEHTKSAWHPTDRGIGKVDTSMAVPLEMKAGQILLIHPKLIHGSGKNLSARERMAVLCSYQIPKRDYPEFWAKAGARFIRGGKKDWGPLAVSSPLAP